MKNSFFSRFVPKEGKFFPMLKELSQTVLSASDLLIESLQYDSQEKRMEYHKRIKEVELAGDRMANLIFKELGKTFITPFDREDIHDLASAVDDVTDYINGSSKRIAIYNPHVISDSGKELASLIREAASHIVKAMDELETFSRNPECLSGHCFCLHEIENRADDIYEQFITRLFREEKDSIEIIKIKEVMQYLEKATDAAERVGKVLKSMIVKYA